jgi:hypothetical protein
MRLIVKGRRQKSKRIIGKVARRGAAGYLPGRAAGLPFSERLAQKILKFGAFVV